MRKFLLGGSGPFEVILLLGTLGLAVGCGGSRTKARCQSDSDCNQSSRCDVDSGICVKSGESKPGPISASYGPPNPSSLGVSSASTSHAGDTSLAVASSLPVSSHAPPSSAPASSRAHSWTPPSSSTATSETSSTFTAASSAFPALTSSWTAASSLRPSSSSLGTYTSSLTFSSSYNPPASSSGTAISWPPGEGACASAAVVDLDTVGTHTAQQTHFVGDNSTGAATFANTCQPAAVNVVAFHYTVQTTSRLVVSTFHADTTVNLDTVIWAQTYCSFNAPLLGCNDDVTAAELARTPAPPAGHSFQSMFTSLDPASGTLAAGTQAYIFVAGFPRPAASPYLPMGAYHLSVTEVTPPSPPNAACDPSASPGLCVSPVLCNANGPDLSDFTCGGALGSACPTTGSNVCAPGLACNVRGACATQAAAGQVCDLTGVVNVCVSGSRCTTVNGSPVCLAAGSQGAACRTTAPACDTGLGCSASTCVPLVPQGATCDRTNLCAPPNVCNLGVCGLPGTTNAVCGTRPAPVCAAGFSCLQNSPYSSVGYCQPSLNAGQPCSLSLQPPSVACNTGMECAATGGPASCQVQAYTTSPSPAPWVECASAGGTNLPYVAAYGDNYFPLTLPFAFPVFGDVHWPGSPAWLTERGVLGLGSVQLPTPGSAYQPSITPLSGALMGCTPCAVTVGSPPSPRTAVVQCTGNYNSGYTSGAASFEIQLHETTGVVDVLYGPTNTYIPASAGLSAARATTGATLCGPCSGTTLRNTRFTPAP